MSNVIKFPENRSVKVHIPGELPEVTEVRMVAVTKAQAAVLEMLGERLAGIGAPSSGAVLLNLAAAWKVSA